jgi:hypothetical protein
MTHTKATGKLGRIEPLKKKKPKHAFLAQIFTVWQNPNFLLEIVLQFCAMPEACMYVYE